MSTTISENLKKIRSYLGWSQGHAAKQLDISRPRLGSYEEARALPPIELLPKLSVVYGITDWKGFITDPHFDPGKQVADNQSFIDQKYQLLQGKDKTIVDILLKISAINC